jgi:hypothetical protein
LAIRELVELSGTAAELAGVALIVGGVVVATVRTALSPKGMSHPHIPQLEPCPRAGRTLAVAAPAQSALNP